MHPVQTVHPVYVCGVGASRCVGVKLWTVFCVQFINVVVVVVVVVDVDDDDDVA